MIQLDISQTYGELREYLGSRLTFLPDKPEETLDSTLRALWFAAAGLPKSAELASFGDLPALDEIAFSKLNGLVESRLGGVPLAHITARQHFMGMDMLAGPEALVPRKETELLGTAAVERAREAVSDRGRALVVDVCTGCGNIALSVAGHVPNAVVYAADLSDAAVQLGRRNAVHLGLERQIEFRVGDLLEPFATSDFFGQVDLLTCNPPYINSVKVGQMPDEIAGHEPKLAFDGGPFGVGILMRVLEDAPRFLRVGGWLGIEVGLGQGPAMSKRIQRGGAFQEVRPITDHRGDVRAILAQR